jgi:hypothetical protein
VIAILVLILLVATGALVVALSLPTGLSKRFLALCRKEISDQGLSITLFLLWVFLTLAACPWIVSSLANSLPKELHLTREFMLTDRTPLLAEATQPAASVIKPMMVAIDGTVSVVAVARESMPTATLTSTSMPSPTSTPTPMPTPTVTPTPTPTATRTPTPTPEVVAVALSDVQIYSCPSKNPKYRTSRIVPAGEWVKIIGWNEDEGVEWHLIRNDGAGTQQWWVIGSDSLSFRPANYKSYVGRATCRYHGFETYLPLVLRNY